MNLFHTINIKSIRSVLAGKILDSSPQAMSLQYGENSYLFIFQFGAVVFFNMPVAEMTREVDKLRSTLGKGLPSPTSENYMVNVGDFPTRVEFEYVELKKLSSDNLRLIALTLGQSAALEYYEVLAEAMLLDTSSFMQNLSATGTFPLQTRKLLKIIGSAASTRQSIISNLAILDPPDETWKSKELEKLFRELQQNFDIDLRFRTLDRKLTLVQDNIEILADLVETRKTNILEALIVGLIVLEIVLAFVKKGI